MGAQHWQRARSRDRKAQRRHAILAEAEKLLEQRDVAAINMTDIAAGTGVCKATLYLYFKTREALFVALTECVLERWFAAVADALTVPCGAASLCRILSAELDREPVLPKLLSVLHTTLEHNLDDAEIKRFKHVLKDRMTALGQRIDTAAGWSSGAGLRVLLRLHVCIIGATHVANPSPPVQRALEDDNLALFRLEFQSLLDDLLPLVVHPQ
jgi:AcrR family transcriptional regulator